MKTGGPVIHLYCLCWNEVRMLPYFFRHYADLVDRFVVFDNGSTDGSLDLLAANPRVQVTDFQVPGDSFVDEERRLSDVIWHSSRGSADWVMMLDIDEHLHHPDLPGYLQRCTAEGVTAIRSIGYEMVAEAFPSAQARLCDLVTAGVRSFGHDKLCLFDPNRITETRYGPGRHTAFPEGDVVWPAQRVVRMLHYKKLGVEYVLERNALLRTGLRRRDIEAGWGFHYLFLPDAVARDFAELNGRAKPVPGLAGAVEGTRDEDLLIEASGLFLPEWYVRAYPDGATTQADPLAHFCAHGWREGRKPNPHFDPRWYAASYPDAAGSGANPLARYIAEGEAAGHRPIWYFDPSHYRRRYGLPGDQSPLRHYLAHRQTGRFSPIPEFDAEHYLRLYPDVARVGADPFDHYLSFGFREGRTPSPLPDAASRLRSFIEQGGRQPGLPTRPPPRAAGWPEPAP